ncbi:MAG: hypothetical protein HOV81_23730, partial [Kofleriaceae bacterium]|nr:hypothetical protein [Kofleriaceae bacterium]
NAATPSTTAADTATAAPANTAAAANTAAPANAAAAANTAAAPANTATAANTAAANTAAASTPAVAPKSAIRALMKPSAEVAAIKIELEPNWDRDLGEAGTFSLVVKVPNTEDTRVFSFHYGYEDDAAPVECDQYRKYLEDKKVMTVTLNRQRGAACYIEGNEGSAGMTFRYLVTYGGKHLLCRGSLYKDGASSALGDLRDKVLMQAKKICETLSL